MDMVAVSKNRYLRHDSLIRTAGLNVRLGRHSATPLAAMQCLQGFGPGCLARGLRAYVCLLSPVS